MRAAAAPKRCRASAIPICRRTIPCRLAEPKDHVRIPGAIPGLRLLDAAILTSHFRSEQARYARAGQSAVYRLSQGKLTAPM
jgi:hypothetical protein